MSAKRVKTGGIHHEIASQMECYVVHYCILSLHRLSSVGSHLHTDRKSILRHHRRGTAVLHSAFRRNGHTLGGKHLEFAVESLHREYDNRRQRLVFAECRSQCRCLRLLHHRGEGSQWLLFGRGHLSRRQSGIRQLQPDRVYLYGTHEQYIER